MKTQQPIQNRLTSQGNVSLYVRGSPIKIKISANTCYVNQPLIAVNMSKPIMPPQYFNMSDNMPIQCHLLTQETIKPLGQEASKPLVSKPVFQYVPSQCHHTTCHLPTQETFKPLGQEASKPLVSKLVFQYMPIPCHTQSMSPHHMSLTHLGDI